MGIFDRLKGKAKTSASPYDHGAHSHEDAHVHEGAPGSAHDPVCDMWVDPKKAPAKSDHKGQTIYFCTPGCKKAFDANPAKYLPKLKHAK